jgi:predicted aconitase
MLGCPQYSYDQLMQVEHLMAGHSVSSGVAFWIMASVDTAELAARSGMRGKLEKLGVRLAIDTCIDEPCWKSFEGGLGVTDSPKCAYYRERRGQPFVIRRLSECADAAIRGRIS